MPLLNAAMEIDTDSCAQVSDFEVGAELQANLKKLNRAENNAAMAMLLCKQNAQPQPPPASVKYPKDEKTIRNFQSKLLSILLCQRLVLVCTEDQSEI